VGARLLRHVFDEVHYNYAADTFRMIRDVPEREPLPNFAVMSERRAHRAGKGRRNADGRRHRHGQPLGHPSARVELSPDDYTPIDTLLGTAPNGDERQVGVYPVPLAFPSGLRREQMVIWEADGKPCRPEAGFGADLWKGGTLVLDGQYRRACAKGGDGFARTHGS